MHSLRKIGASGHSDENWLHSCLGDLLFFLSLPTPNSKESPRETPPTCFSFLMPAFHFSTCGSWPEAVTPSAWWFLPWWASPTLLATSVVASPSSSVAFFSTYCKGWWRIWYCNHHKNKTNMNIWTASPIYLVSSGFMSLKHLGLLPDLHQWMARGLSTWRRLRNMSETSSKEFRKLRNFMRMHKASWLQKSWRICWGFWMFLIWVKRCVFSMGLCRFNWDPRLGLVKLDLDGFHDKKNGLVQLVAPPLIDHLWKEFGCNSIILATSLLWLELNWNESVIACNCCWASDWLGGMLIPSWPLHFQREISGGHQGEMWVGLGELLGGGFATRCLSASPGSAFCLHRPHNTSSICS